MNGNAIEGLGFTGVQPIWRITFAMLLFSFAHMSAADSTVFNVKNVELKMRNPGLLGSFSVTGMIYLSDSRLEYFVYTDSVFLGTGKPVRAYKFLQKVYRYNFMARNLSIPFDQIVTIRGGFSLLSAGKKIIVKTDRGLTYRFLTSESRHKKEIVKFIRPRMRLHE